MVGQDGGQSIPLAKGSLFLFADTLLAPADAPLDLGAHELVDRRTGIFLANCAGISHDGETLMQAMGAILYIGDDRGLPRELLQASALETFAGWRLWPLHGAAQGEKVYFFYIAIRPLPGGGMWDYDNKGIGLALLDLNDESCTRLERNGDWRFWPELPESVHVGVQVLRAGEWTYVFGSRRDGLEFRAFVARVKKEAIDDPSQYEFLLSQEGERASWGDDWRASLTLGECGREFSVSWNAYLGRYLMLYLDPYKRSLQMRFAERPYGPYSAPVAAPGRVPCDPRTDLVSLGFEHPQYAREEGRELAVSYSQPRFLQNTLLAVRLR